MKTFLTTAAIVAALTFPALAEGEPTGTEAAGEANGSFKASAQEPSNYLIWGPMGQYAMAEGRLLPRPVVRTSRISNANEAESWDGFFMFGSPATSGMDGGNRR